MQKTFSVVRCKQTVLLSHIEVAAKKIAGPCLKAFQGYLPPWETKTTTEAIYIQADAAYQDQLELGLGLSWSLFFFNFSLRSLQSCPVAF